MATEQEKQEAEELAKRAGTQAKQAAKNTGRAGRKLASIAVEETGDVVESVNDAAEEKIAEVERGMRKIFKHAYTKSAIGVIIGMAGFSYAAWVSGRALKADELAKELARARQA